MGPWIRKALTANRLTDGLVVFLTKGGDWSPAIDQAAVADDQTAGAHMEAAGERAVAQQTVVAPYLIDVEVERHLVRPVQLRERIRAYGPTV